MAVYRTIKMIKNNDFQCGTSYVDLLCFFSFLWLLCLCARLFICADLLALVCLVLL